MFLLTGAGLPSAAFRVRRTLCLGRQFAWQRLLIRQRVDALWRVDLANGSAEYVGWTSFLDLEAIALDDQGTLFGADDDSKTLVKNQPDLRFGDSGGRGKQSVQYGRLGVRKSLISA